MAIELNVKCINNFWVLGITIVLIFGEIHHSSAQYQRRPRPGQRGQGSLDSYPTCLNPDKKYGNCIPISKCQPLYNILREYPINRQSVLFLQRSTCGFGAEEPDVCCLSKDITGGVTTERPERTTERTTQKPTTVPPKQPTIKPNNVHATVDSLDSFKNIQDKVTIHRNLNLLPTLETCGKVVTLSNIIGGHDAGLGAYPWMVLLGFVDSEGGIQYACGGTLISKLYVLSAAHCVAKLPSGFKLSVVRVGEYDQNEEVDCADGLCAPRVQDIPIQDIIYHDDYDKTSKKENDIALLRLQKPANFGTFVSPICLPLPQFDIFSKAANLSKLTVAGWGRTDFKSEDSATVLQQVKVPIITKEECNRFYKSDGRLGEIGEGRFCSGGEANRDSCKGDSGGPIMEGILLKSTKSPLQPITRVFQFGIVSVGPARCGTEGQPALYTKISFFLPWILDHMKP